MKPVRSVKVVGIQGQRGTIERVGAIDTLVRDGEHAWSTPNAALIDERVIR